VEPVAVTIVDVGVVEHQPFGNAQAPPSPRPGKGHVDLRREHIGEFMQRERRLVREDARVIGPEPEDHELLVLGRREVHEEAVRRLDLQVSEVTEYEGVAQRRVGGEVIIPPGRVLTVSAPVAGSVRTAAPITPGAVVQEGDELLRLVPLAPVDRDTRARASREVEAARANLTAAEARLTRTQALAEGRAGSQRAIEEATAARDVAQADLDVARARARTLRSSPLLADVSMRVRAPEAGIVRAVSVASGQAVAAGAPLLEIVAAQELWVRVPVSSGDIRRLVSEAPAEVSSLAVDEGARPIVGRPVAGPPTAAPLAGTVDRYFALDASSAYFAPGERVLVWLALAETEAASAIPFSSVFYDPTGTAWIYVVEGERAYRRARVDVLRRDGEQAVLARGPDLGTGVVSVGAAELYGAEFEPGH